MIEDALMVFILPWNSSLGFFRNRYFLQKASRLKSRDITLNHVIITWRFHGNYLIHRVHHPVFPVEFKWHACCKINQKVNTCSECVCQVNWVNVTLWLSCTCYITNTVLWLVGSENTRFWLDNVNHVTKYGALIGSCSTSCFTHWIRTQLCVHLTNTNSCVKTW